MIEIRIIGSFIAIDNREKSRDCPSSSNNPVVSDNRRSDNRDLTVVANHIIDLILYYRSACKTCANYGKLGKLIPMCFLVNSHHIHSS